MKALRITLHYVTSFVALILLLQTDNPMSAASGEERDAGCTPLSFTYDTYLGHTVVCDYVPEQHVLPGKPYWEAHPAYLKLQFSGYPFPNSLGLGPTIYVFPVHDSYSSLFPGRQDDPWLEQVHALQAILRDRPAWTAPAWQAGQPMTNPPLLPLINASNIYLAKQKYMSFGSGSGVRYLAQVSQGTVPPSQSDTFYIFQGITDEDPPYEYPTYGKRIHITAVFPAFLAEPPGVPPNVDFAAQAQLTTNALERTDGAAFNPDLRMLDNLVASFKIAYPLPLADGPGLIDEPGMPDSGATGIPDPYITLLMLALCTVAAGIALRIQPALRSSPRETDSSLRSE